MNTNTSKRQFLRTMGALAASINPGMRAGLMPLATSLAGMASLASQSSHAADSAGAYKALVCLFMHGGNDSHNWVVPIDPNGYAEYAAARREIAWAADRIDPITVSNQASGRAFGMPRDLAALRKWYESGQVAIVPNVGHLNRPVSRAEFQSGVGIPSKLFSHNDQASCWQSLMAEGARSGWGGRMGDALMSANAYPVFTCVSPSGNAVFLSGAGITQYQMGTEGPAIITAINSKPFLGYTGTSAPLTRVLGATSAEALQTEYAKITQRSIDSAQLLQAALGSSRVMDIPSSPIALGTGKTISLNQDGLALQLRSVARMMAAGQSLGMKRQVFLVSIGGFDSHANQMKNQPSLMQRVALSVDYFLTAMSTAGMLNNVALFTASEFGRTLLSNGSGSDHGWGSHHFVAGGSIRGRTMHGRFPLAALGTADDVGSGRLLPSASVSQLAAPLCRWMGVSNADLQTILPGISNFDIGALQISNA